jgi:hypothetical protein
MVMHWHSDQANFLIISAGMPLRQIDGEEQAASGEEVAAIVGHGAIFSIGEVMGIAALHPSYPLRPAPLARSGARIGVYQKAILLRGINVIWVVQSPLAKIFRLCRRANHL